MTITPAIFKAYDVRGLYPSEVNEDAARMIGQGFVVAYQTVVQNRGATERIADELVEKGELYGDDVTSLLDGVGLRKPAIDVLDEAIWPAI